MARSRLLVSFGTKLEMDLLAADEAPPEAQALVVPQDVNFIMGELDAVVESRESAESVLASIEASRPRRLGTLVPAAGRSGAPLLLQAVVYDFDRTPPATEGHVFETLLLAFEEAKGRSFSCLAVRPLGTAYGGLAPLAFLRLLVQVCYSSAELGTSVKRVYLMLHSPDEMGRYEGLLQQILKRPPA